MKTNLLITTLLLGVSPAAFSQMMPGPPPDLIAMELDRNHDHELSSREIKNAARSLKKLDEDRDGIISEEELRPEPPSRERRRKKDDDKNANPPPAPPKSELVAAIDTDGDGSLSKQEIEAAADALLKLDQDGNGELDNTEVPALGEFREEGGFGPPPGGGGGGGRPPHPPRR